MLEEKTVSADLAGTVKCNRGGKCDYKSSYIYIFFLDLQLFTLSKYSNSIARNAVFSSVCSLTSSVMYVQNICI
jgi:hypothetical protein